MYESKKSEMYDMADVPTYEEVVPYRRQNGGKYRLVVLVDTSRAKKNQETDGVDYHFISKQLFETDIHNSKFLEYGKCNGNYYGTSLDPVRSVLSKNKVCLLDVQPHEEDSQEMLSTAQTMETQYGHIFEKVIVNDDLNVAFSELQLALKKVETDTHWIPVNWTHS